MDMIEFAKVMAVVVAATGAPKATKEQLDVYFELLGDIPLDVLRAAALRAVMDHGYPTLPPVGVIRRHAAAMTGPPQVPVADAYAAAKGFADRWYPWLCDGLPTDPKTRARLDEHLADVPELARRAGAAYGWQAVAETPAAVGFAHFRQLYESLNGPVSAEAALPPAARTPAVAALLSGIGRALPGGNGHAH